MKQLFLFTFQTILTLTTIAQKMTVTTLDGSRVGINIVSDSAKQKLLHDFNGKQDNTLKETVDIENLSAL